jgi:apolipoprotein D and lipocalin family protein
MNRLRAFCQLVVGLAAAVCGGCTGIPDHVKAVEPFDVHRYLGRWYEIARLPNSFEKGLERITADYQLRSDGGIDVINRGYDPGKGRWRQAKGKAYFVASPTVGRLKVSFFGPFYGAYNVIDLDSEYRVSLVCGPDYKYLWILSRTPTLPRERVDALLAKASGAGFNTSKMIFVKQDDSPSGGGESASSSDAH